jgi:hypothetical protein
MYTSADIHNFVFSKHVTPYTYIRIETKDIVAYLRVLRVTIEWAVPLLAFQGAVVGCRHAAQVAADTKCTLHVPWQAGPQLPLMLKDHQPVLCASGPANKIVSAQSMLSQHHTCVYCFEEFLTKVHHACLPPAGKCHALVSGAEKQLCRQAWDIARRMFYFGNLQTFATKVRYHKCLLWPL